jgi:tetratricopeptide (TPR) repeat protein
MVEGGRVRGWVVVAGAVSLAAAGGSAAGLGAPLWLAGAVGAVSALVAAVVVDRVYAGWEERASVRELRGRVLDELREAVPARRGDVLGLLRAGRSPVPFRGRGRELARIAAWRDDRAACPVLIVSGPGGSGKTRVVLEAGLRVPPGWAAGWLHTGAGSDAVAAITAGASPALIAVDDAGGRPADVIPLLESLAGQRSGHLARVILVTRSAAGLRAFLEQRLAEHHGWIAADAVDLELGAAGGPDDWNRWYGEAVAAFAAALGEPAPDIPERFQASSGDPARSFIVLQARALLAVLDTGNDSADPRDLRFGQVAGFLMNHEQRWWQASATAREWGGAGPLALAVQERCAAALTLLGADSASDGMAVLRRVPELRDAPAERLSAIASWVLALYPAKAGLAPRIRPDMIGDWFTVTQLTADPDFARSLRAGITDEQAARALALLARAADTIGPAAVLFSEFAAGDIRRAIMAAMQATRGGTTGRRLLDTVIAAQVTSAQDWTLDQIAAAHELVPPHHLLHTRLVLGGLAVDAYRALATTDPSTYQPGLATALNNLGNGLRGLGRYQDALHADEEAVALYRQLAAASPDAHQPGLARALNSLGNGLHGLGRYQEMLAAQTEEVRIFRDMAARYPDLYEAGYRQRLGALRREYDQRGMPDEAIAYDLPSRTPPEPEA